MSSQSVGLNVCERASGHNNDRKLLLGRVQCCTLGSLLAQTFYSDLLPSYYLWQQGLCDPAENCQENGWNRQQNNKYSNNPKPFLLVLLLIVIGCSTFICYLKKILSKPRYVHSSDINLFSEQSLDSETVIWNVSPSGHGDGQLLLLLSLIIECTVARLKRTMILTCCQVDIPDRSDDSSIG